MAGKPAKKAQRVKISTPNFKKLNTIESLISIVIEK